MSRAKLTTDRSRHMQHMTYLTHLFSAQQSMSLSAGEFATVPTTSLSCPTASHLYPPSTRPSPLP